MGYRVNLFFPHSVTTVDDGNIIFGMKMKQQPTKWLITVRIADGTHQKNSNGKKKVKIKLMACISHTHQLSGSMLYPSHLTKTALKN